MMNIRPVSDLRNKYPEIEKIAESGEPVFLTKNGYGSMVLLSLEQYSKLTEGADTTGTTANTHSSADSPETADTSKDKAFKIRRKSKNPAAPENPELQREAEEKNLGKHSMLDHKVLPLPPNANTFRI